VTHDQEEALELADRIVVMRGGVIEQIGTPAEVQAEPATAFVSSFIGETNSPARHPVERFGDGDAGATLPDDGPGAGAGELHIRHDVELVEPGDAAALPVTVETSRPIGRSRRITATMAAGRAVDLRPARRPGRGGRCAEPAPDPLSDIRKDLIAVPRTISPSQPFGHLPARQGMGMRWSWTQATGRSGLKVGQECWRIEQAERMAVIIDAEKYFRMARRAMLRARADPADRMGLRRAHRPRSRRG
jgi:hypothetical protein